MGLLIGAGIAAVLLLVWAICRTKPGEKAEAEAVEASRTAQKAQLEAIFGEQSED
jgi:hypothetical protein